MTDYQYHVLCSHPGMRRGGRENPAHATYKPGDHTAEQLHALLDEPAIIVVLGVRMTADHVGELMRLAAEAEAPPPDQPPDAPATDAPATKRKG